MVDRVKPWFRVHGLVHGSVLGSVDGFVHDFIYGLVYGFFLNMVDYPVFLAAKKQL